MRAAGPDNGFDTADDYFLPVDVWYDTFRYSTSSTLHVYTRGVPAPGRYSMQAAFLDAAGNPAFLSSAITVGATSLYSGPAVTDVDASRTVYRRLWRQWKSISATRWISLL